MKKVLSIAAIGMSTSAVHAQFSSQLQNLTISFSPDDASSSDCSTAPDARAISFSTNMAPSDGICFNLEDLFASNNTLNSTGYYNYTGNLYAVPWPISYSLTNTEAFDSAANYSRIWYQQTNTTGNGESGSGDAAIAINVYPDKDCRQTRLGGANAPPDTPMWPWYGWSCQSEEEGQCRTTEYAVKSIFINDASKINSRASSKKCWDFAEAGDANGLQRTSFWLGFLGVAAAAMMAV